jgi:hypothetical protein
MPVADGALVTVEEIKRYLNINHTADDEDISDLILGAEGQLQSYLGRRLLAVLTTEDVDGGRMVYWLKNYPVDPASLEVLDNQLGVAVPAQRYSLDSKHRKVSFTAHTSLFGPRRLTFQYTGGLSLDPDWDVVIRPELKKTIKQLIIGDYDNPDPMLRAEGSGAGLVRSVVYDEGIPLRVREVWDKYRRVV